MQLGLIVQDIRLLMKLYTIYWRKCLVFVLPYAKNWAIC